MSAHTLPDFVSGIFKRELPRRFLCEVTINNENFICYVPSSCHLNRFLNLKGKKVILVPTQNAKAKTKYSLFAVPYRNSFITLNSSRANTIIEENINKKIFSYLGTRKTIRREHWVNGYKSDLYIEDTKTLIEIKSVISTQVDPLFPTVYSTRAITQLKKLRELKASGYNIYLFIISLNPYVKKIRLNKQSDFYQEIIQCLNSGVILKAYSCSFQKGNLTIGKPLDLE